MELTPIKIPGKRKRSNTKIAVAARKALNRKPGRPFKALQNDHSETLQHAPQTVKPPKIRTLKTLKSKRKMSLLEKLPTELLERVFQFCLNLDLPKASPVIAGKMGSRTVFNWTVMRVFEPSWARGYLRDEMDLLENGGNNTDTERYAVGDWGEEDGELQSQVLRCRWASLEVLLKAKEAWIQRYAADRQFVPLYFLKAKNKSRAVPSPHSTSTEPFITQIPNTPPPAQPPPSSEPESDTQDPHLTPTQYHDEDYSSFLTFLDQPDGPSPWPLIDWSPDLTSTLSPNLEIPNSLLTPPFTSTSLQYLFHLLKCGARVSWLTSTSGEVALEGLKDAIREGNVEAVHLLVWSGLSERLDVELLVWAIRNVGSSPDSDSSSISFSSFGDRDGPGLEQGTIVVLSLAEKMRTINQILRLGFTDVDTRERGMIEAELLEMRDEAVMRDDEEGLEFVKRIVESETLRGLLDVRV